MRKKQQQQHITSRTLFDIFLNLLIRVFGHVYKSDLLLLSMGNLWNFISLGFFSRTIFKD